MLCLNQEKSVVYWFKGKGMIATINVDTLEKTDFEVSITSSNFIRKIDVNEQETLLASLDIDFKRLMIFSLLEKKRLSSWEYNIKGVEDSKSFTMCCSFDKKLILIGGEAGDLMQKTPLVTLHHFTEKMELIDMLVITGQRDPIINLTPDIHSGIIFATDISQNVYFIRIGDSLNLQLLRILPKVQEGKYTVTADYSVGFAFWEKHLFFSSLSNHINTIKFSRNENMIDYISHNITSVVNPNFK